ncbi:hypothetical protein [Bacillus solitudinis]|uniref:hypothetical protein n=1 Tax=Bacillus solitudinis TaxID=2014074 RepID=UPI000C242DDD|nr:hypothetical protein [Bacillus solitudinis]
MSVTSDPYKKGWDHRSNHSIDKGVPETDDIVKVKGELEVTPGFLKTRQNEEEIELIKGVSVISKESNEIIIKTVWDSSLCK